MAEETVLILAAVFNPLCYDHFDDKVCKIFYRYSLTNI
jgi:hypothetical protein